MPLRSMAVNQKSFEAKRPVVVPADDGYGVMGGTNPCVVVRPDTPVPRVGGRARVTKHQRFEMAPIHEPWLVAGSPI
jgi:hypothetical protein